MPDLHVLETEPIGEDVVAKLEEALSEAREGKLSSVGIALVYRDGSTNWCHSKAKSVATLVGAVSRLHAALVRKMDG